MKLLQGLLLAVCLAAPAAAVETLFTQARGTATGKILDQGNKCYALEVTINGTPHIWKACQQNQALALLHGHWHDKIGETRKCEAHFCMRGDLSGSILTAEVFIPVFCTDVPIVKFGGICTHERRTGTISSIGVGKYRLTDETGEYDLIYPAQVFGELSKLDAAIASGDPITLGGYYCDRGVGPGTGRPIEKYFVVEDFVD